jgi:hypothetical protein
MPAFIIRILIFLGDILLPQAVRQALIGFFLWLTPWFAKMWAPIGMFFYWIFENILRGIWGHIVRFFNILFGAEFWAKWFQPILRWFGKFLTKPFKILAFVVLAWVVEKISNLFGFSVAGSAADLALDLSVNVIAFVLDKIFTLIDFAPLIALLNEWLGLPSCFVELALSVGLSSALSVLFLTAIACVSVSLVVSFMRAK